MGALDFQLGVKTESTYATAVTVDRFFEYDSESIEETYARTAGDPLRVGTRFTRSDRFQPYFAGAAGSLDMAVLTKGFGWWLTHMLGSASTTGPTETSVYTHTGVEGELYGQSFTLQVNRPFHPSGTDQAFTYAGGKVTEWTLSNSVEDNLMLSLGLDFASVATGTALASASYPTGMENFTWAGGTVTIGGAAYDVTEFSVTCNNGLDVERRQIRGNTQKKEPTGARRELSFAISADFDSLTQRNRAASSSAAGALAEIEATWVGPTLLGTTLYPSVTVTIPAARFDAWSGSVQGPEAISQSLSGMGLHNGTDPVVSVALANADATA